MIPQGQKNLCDSLRHQSLYHSRIPTSPLQPGCDVEINDVDCDVDFSDHGAPSSSYSVMGGLLWNRLA